MTKTSPLSIENRAALDAVLGPFIKKLRGRLDLVRDSLVNEGKNPKSRLMEWGKASGAYPLMCAFGQEIVVYNAEDSGLVAHPFITDAISETPFSHCAAILPVRMGGEEKALLVDLTFSQFGLPQDLYALFGLNPMIERKSPIKKLQASEAGKDFLKIIQEQGYVVLTPETSKLYLDSLFINREFREDEAYRLLLNPPYHPMNLKHGRSRLAKKGGLGVRLGIPASEPMHEVPPLPFV